ncbi:MAG: RNA polymerase sigma factor [Cyclobacteriaceae bacterium]
MKVSKNLKQEETIRADIGSGPAAYIVEDKVLWESFKEGSESAFVDIYNVYFQPLYDFGRQFSGDTDLVKDCIQEVFINIRVKRKNLPKVISIKSYLLKSLRNKILTEIRDSRKNLYTNIDNPSLKFSTTPSHESILINRQFTRDQVRVIQELLSKLTERQREAIYHFYYSNLGYEEIRTIMGFSSTRAVRNLVYRALSEVKKSFGKIGR